MSLDKKILDALYRAVDETNELLPEDQRMARDPDAPVFGPDSNLDSIGLVSFIVAAEANLDEQLGRTIILADERALSRSHSPFRTLGTLAEYVKERAADADPNEAPNP